MDNFLVYVRTDKNGTKIYHDYRCPKCGGIGGADQWVFTGYTCYRCGGSGRTDKPEVVKKYTPEYKAKLDAQRAKRAEKKRLERVAEFKDNLPKLIEEKGFNADGKVYVAVGDTYSIKDQLREAGAKWKSAIRSWVFTEKPKDYATVELTAEECLDFYEDDGYVSWKSLNYKELIQSKLPKEDTVVSEYVGSIGERIEREVTLEKVRSWDVTRRSFYGGYETDTKVLYVFRDSLGNILVWNTTGYRLEATEGDKLILRGTVAEHKEYAGEKQTSLKRCSVKAVEAGEGA